MEAKKVNKKGIFQLTGQVLALVVVAIVISVGAVILTSLQTGQATGSVAFNATQGGLTGLSNVSSQLGLVGLIVVFSVIIALVIGLALGGAFRGKGGR